MSRMDWAPRRRPIPYDLAGREVARVIVGASSHVEDPRSLTAPHVTDPLLAAMVGVTGGFLDLTWWATLDGPPAFSSMMDEFYADTSFVLGE